MVNIRTKQLKASTNYSYSYSGKDLDGSAYALLGNGQDAWVTYVLPCEGDELINSPGSVRIESVDGTTVRGSMTATLYSREDCAIQSRKFTARFKLNMSGN